MAGGNWGGNGEIEGRALLSFFDSFANKILLMASSLYLIYIALRQLGAMFT